MQKGCHRPETANVDLEMTEPRLPTPAGQLTSELTWISRRPPVRFIPYTISNAPYPTIERNKIEPEQL